MAEAEAGRVRIEEAVVFGRGGGRELRCDLFHPPQSGALRPAVLLIHGGAWSQGDRSQLRGYGIQLARRGYVCASLEYRLSGESKWPAQLHDVKAGVRFMRAKSAALGVDPAKICVSGNSAGAHLALLLAGTPNLPELEGEGGHAEAGSECAACIAFYAPTKLFGSYPPSTYAPGLFEAGVTEATGRLASPIEYARKDFPPTLLIHGNRDQLVRPSASLTMYEALSEAGAPVELHMYNGAPHGFDANRELGRQCVELMHLFLDRHVVSPRQVAAPWEGARSLRAASNAL
jgi:acetyl esterase/lipase